MEKNQKREKSHWRGHISFGLVSIAVRLFPTVNKAADISFHQIDKRNNARIHYQRINDVTGKKVEWKDIVKGYEYDKDTLVPVPDEVLKKVGGESTRSIDIDAFVDQKALDLTSIDKSYIVVPDTKNEKGYVILREALLKSGKIGIAKITLSTKEYIAALAPYEGKALVLYLLHYNKEMRKIEDLGLPDKSISEYKITKKEIDIAQKLILSMSEKWNPKNYKDEFQEHLHKWAKEVVTNTPHRHFKVSKVKKTSNVIDFVELLKKSIQEKKPKAKPRKTAK